MPKIKEEVSTTDIFYLSEFENSTCNDEDSDTEEKSAKKNAPHEDDAGANRSPKRPCKCKYPYSRTCALMVALVLIVGVFTTAYMMWIAKIGKNLHHHFKL